MSYRIDIGPEARFDFETLPSEDRRQAQELIGALAATPCPLRAKSLCSDPAVFRIWLASLWRVGYQVDEQAKCVRILRIYRPALYNYESFLHGDSQDATGEFRIGARRDGSRAP